MPDHPSSELQGTFREPFPEQVAFFRGKLGNLVPTERWDDMLGDAHDTGFMVAGAAKADLLTDFAAAVDRSIAEGKSLGAFRKDFDAIVAKHGWTGWTGEDSKKGRAWRVRTIYRTNAMTSYSAGRLAQLKAGNFAFWVYRHGGSREPRPEHLSWDGMALPPDHEFWKTHYPPSDWGCSCYVTGARSARGVKRLGGDPDKKLPKNWQKIDPKTGAPVGIGRGWNYAPGATVVDTVRALAPKIGKWDHRIATAFLEDLPPEHADAISEAYRSLPSTADDLRRYAQRVFDRTEGATGDMGPLPAVKTLGMARTRDVDRVNAVLGGDAIRKGGFDFSLDREFTGHIRDKHGPGGKNDIPIEPADFALLPAMVNSPDRIGRGNDRKPGPPRVLFRKAIGRRVYEAVFELRGGKRSLALKSFYVVRLVR